MKLHLKYISTASLASPPKPPLKNYEDSVFTDLLKFLVESGNGVMNKHLKFGAKNSLYITHEIQNKLIKLVLSTSIKHY